MSAGRCFAFDAQSSALPAALAADWADALPERKALARMCRSFRNPLGQNNSSKMNMG